MKSITQKEIGRRIMELRKAKGLSQEDLAKEINLSRPSLAQIELGNRSVDIIEFQKLALTLGFSLDAFLGKKTDPNSLNESNIQYVKTQPTKKDVSRVSVPTINADKFKNVLLYILENCAGKPNIGETVLNKLLYFCDFNYYELYEEHLTGAKYKKLPFGPVPQKMESIINELILKNQLKRIKTEYHGFIQIRNIPLVKADLTQLTAAEKTTIDHVLQQMSDWNANMISNYSHKDMPWLATADGDIISYNLAFYRELPYSVRIYDEENSNILL